MRGVRLLLGLVALLLGVLAPAGAAGAAGDPGLDARVIVDPIGGWVPEPTANLDRLVNYVDQLVAPRVGQLGGTALTAVEGWRSKTDASDSLVVALVALSYAGQDAKAAAYAAHQSAVTALASLCTGVTGSSVTTWTVPNVAGGHGVSCPGTGGAPAPAAVGFARANVVTLIVSQQALFSQASLSSLAHSQYVALSADGYAPAGRTPGILGWVLVVAAAGVLACGAYSLVMGVESGGRAQEAATRRVTGSRSAGRAGAPANG